MNRRKKRPGEKAFRTTVFLTDKLRKQLGHVAVDEDTTKSDVIRKAIEEYGERHYKPERK